MSLGLRSAIRTVKNGVCRKKFGGGIAGANHGLSYLRTASKQNGNYGPFSFVQMLQSAGHKVIQRTKEIKDRLNLGLTASSKTWSTPLLNSSKQIRLIRLPEVLGEHGQIVITMQNYELNQLPVYRALSYSCGPPFWNRDPRLSTWHRPAEELKIVCNGQSVQVGQNLLEALENVVPKYPGILLWIDALCIDQQNDVEKLRQIYLMDAIYKNAAEVVVWLGPDSNWRAEPAAENLDLVKAYDMFNTKREYWSRDAEANRKRWTELLCLPPAELDYFLIGAVAAIMDMLTRSCWTRKWTFQEAVLAKKTAFIYGPHVFDPGQLQRLAEHLLTPRVLPADVADPFARMIRFLGEIDWSDVLDSAFFPTTPDLNVMNANDEVNATRHVMRGTDGEHGFAVILLLLVTLTRNRTATEPRDMVLSLMGVAKTIAERRKDDVKSDFTVSERSAHGFLREHPIICCCETLIWKF